MGEVQVEESCVEREVQKWGTSSRCAPFFPERPRRGEHVVGPEESAELAYGGVLRSENSALTQRQESSRDRGSHAGVPTIRRVHPLGPTPTTPEILESIGPNGGCFVGNEPTGVLRDATDFKAWLLELSEHAAASNTAEEFFRKLN